jgi:hypothetical protein
MQWAGYYKKPVRCGRKINQRRNNNLYLSKFIDWVAFFKLKKSSKSVAADFDVLMQHSFLHVLPP